MSVALREYCLEVKVCDEVGSGTDNTVRMRVTPVDSDIPSCVTNDLDHTLRNDFKTGQTIRYCGRSFFGNCSELEFETGFKISLILGRHWYQNWEKDSLCLDRINIEYYWTYPRLCSKSQENTKKIVTSPSHGNIETEFIPKVHKGFAESIGGWFG